MTENPIVLMLCYARSGGTILNRCLGSLPNTIVLSEVNPLGGGWGLSGSSSPTTPKQQSLEWYGIEIKANDFTESIAELYEYCSKKGLSLVIRDWSFINFSPHSYNNNSPPKRFLIYEALMHFNLPVIPFAFLRDSIDVWISRGTPNTQIFYDAYLPYLYRLNTMGIKTFKYEDFCHEPSSFMRSLCDYCNLPYNAGVLVNPSFKSFNGDSQRGNRSRSLVEESIKPKPRKYLTSERIKLIERSNQMQEANRLSSYPVSYYAAFSSRQRIKLALVHSLERIQKLLPLKSRIF